MGNRRRDDNDAKGKNWGWAILDKVAQPAVASLKPRGRCGSEG